jgi:glyoxalase family protein
MSSNDNDVIDRLEPIAGLHHVTAITAQAPRNLEYYTRQLGLRLVKKTVNQDDLSAYHLFYGDEVGHPGTEVTFFDWEHIPPHRAGAGTIGPISLRVPDEAALGWWADRVGGEVEAAPGRTSLSFLDPEGQRLELVSDGGRPGTPWQGSPVPPEAGIRGLYGVTITVAALEPTAGFLTQVLGFRQTGEGGLPGDAGSLAVFATGDGGPGTEVRVAVPAQPVRGQPGAGGVHHVAFRAADPEQQAAWRALLVEVGVQVTPVIDRWYFHSIYFHEPGGSLFEIATDGPGFTGDEPVDRLGERLSLPPFLEGRRAEIEAGLKPLETAREA